MHIIKGKYSEYYAPLVSHVVNETIKQQRISKIDLLRQINKTLPDDMQYSLSIVYHWSNGRNIPTRHLMLYLRKNGAQPWIRDFASRILDVLDS